MSIAGLTAAVLGGDRRMVAAAESLAERGAWVRVAGLVGDPRAASLVRCAGVEEALVGAQILVLPVQPLGADGRVYTEPPVPALGLRPAYLDLLPAGAFLFIGQAPANWREEAHARGLDLVEYRDRDDFAIYNSVPSAEGAIAMAMTASDLVLAGNRSLVLGPGRTGETLATVLRGLGARVTVAARAEIDRARAQVRGYESVSFAELDPAIQDADFVFNTVPAMVLDRSRLSLLPRHAVVVDLATAPGGTDFAAAAELGVTAQLAPGLPGRVAPVSAGRIVADMVARYIEGQRYPAPASGSEGADADG